MTSLKWHKLYCFVHKFSWVRVSELWELNLSLQQERKTLCLAPARAALSVVIGVLEVGTWPQRHALAWTALGRGGGAVHPQCLRDTTPLSPRASSICTAWASINQHFHSAVSVLR